MERRQHLLCPSDVAADVEDDQRGGELEMLAIATTADIHLILPETPRHTLAVPGAGGEWFGRPVSFDHKEAKPAAFGRMVFEAEERIRNEVFSDLPLADRISK